MLTVLISMQPFRRVRTLDEAKNNLISGGAPLCCGAPPEIRPANKSQVEISDLWERQKDNTKSSR